MRLGKGDLNSHQEDVTISSTCGWEVRRPKWWEARYSFLCSQEIPNVSTQYTRFFLLLTRSNKRSSFPDVEPSFTWRGKELPIEYPRIGKKIKTWARIDKNWQELTEIVHLPYNSQNYRWRGALNKKYLRVADLVAETGLNEETIRSYIRRKQLPAIRMGRDYLIDPDDWEAFKRKRRTIDEDEETKE